MKPDHDYAVLIPFTFGHNKDGYVECIGTYTDDSGQWAMMRQVKTSIPNTALDTHSMVDRYH